MQITQRHRLTFVALAVLAYFIGAAPHLFVVVTTGNIPDALLWNLSHFHVSYQEYGFLRRGLIGSAVAPVERLLTDGGRQELAFMLTLDFAIVVGLFGALAQVLLPDGRPARGQAFLAVAFLLTPAGAMQMGYDMARLDHINFGLVALALLSISYGRIAGAGILMGLAVLVHEAALFYGAPIVVAAAIARRGNAAGLAVAAPALFAAIALYLFGGTDADLATLMPAEVNIAASVWTRDLLEPARGFPPLHYLIAAYFAFVPLLLLQRHYAHNDKRPDLAMLAPFAALALFALGVDYGRWTHCLFMAVLATIAMAPPRRMSPGLDLTPAWSRAAISIWLIPAGPIGIALLYPLIPWII